MKNVLKLLLVIPCFSFYQCKTQNKPFGLISSEDGGTANTAARASIKDINSLTAYTGSASIVQVNEKDRGGRFELVHNTALKDDYGMIFPSAGKKDMHWVRQIAADDPVNLKFYGAKGEGMAHYQDDSAALVKAIAYIAGKGGGKLYIPASTSFYGYNGLGILLPDNIEVYGDGDKSEIKHINPEVAGSFYRGVIFYTTSYGPNNFNGITRAPTYEIQDAKKGQSSITTKTNDASSKWKAGDIVGLGANYFFKQNLEFKARWAQFELNEITKVDGNTAYLKYPLSVDLLYAQPILESDYNELPKKGKEKKELLDKTVINSNAKKQTLNEQNEKNTGYPVIIDISANKTHNEQFNAYDRISRNIYMHDLKLSQADYNMIRNTPYAYSKQPNNVIGLGGTFESRFDHLTLEGVGTFGGNLWNRCEISNLTIYSQWKLVDLGYGSANTKMHDIHWIFKPTKIRDTSTALVYLDDGTHDIELYNIKVSGPWSLGNIIQVSGGAHNISVHDAEIDLPQYDRDQGRAILIKDDNNQVYVHDLTFKNVVFNVKNIQIYININGLDIPGVNKNIRFEGVHFSQQTQHTGPAVSVNNSRGLQFSDVSIPAGNIVLNNVPQSVVQNVKAPNSNIVFSGQKPQVVNSTYKQLKAGTGGGGGRNNF